MNFETGSIAFRMLELPRPLPQDFAQRFAAHRAGPLEAVGASEQRGWVTGRHLLDSAIDEDSAKYGGTIRLALRRAERKVPTSLLKAECRAEELAVMAAEGKTYLRAKQRAEIRLAVTERLLPAMPPTLRAIPFVCEPAAFHLFVGAPAVEQLDVFNAALAAAVGFGGEPSTPETLAKLLKRVDLRDLTGSAFSPQRTNDVCEHAPGREFLTWLWFNSERANRMVPIGNQTIGVLIEGPLAFANEGTGAHSAVLRRGLPESSVEAKSCLLANKKLQSARITFARNEETQWRFTLSADDFVVRGMKLPTGEGKLDAVSRFQERMAFLQDWRNLFVELFKTYLDVRTDSRAWSLETGRIREWISAKPSRA